MNPALGSEGTNEEKIKSIHLHFSYFRAQLLSKKGNDKVQLGGVVIGLAMNSVHYYETEEGYPREVKISKSDMEKEGKKQQKKLFLVYVKSMD